MDRHINLPPIAHRFMNNPSSTIENQIVQFVHSGRDINRKWNDSIPKMASDRCRRANSRRVLQQSSLTSGKRKTRARNWNQFLRRVALSFTILVKVMLKQEKHPLQATRESSLNWLGHCNPERHRPRCYYCYVRSTVTSRENRVHMSATIETSLLTKNSGEQRH